MKGGRKGERKRQKEEEKKREVLNNPVKMKKIKELVSSTLCKH